MLKNKSTAAKAVAVTLWLGVACSAAGADAWTDAIAQRDVAALARQAEHAPDINRPDEAGHTALMVAARQGAAPLARVLLARGADANATNGRGGTALMYAASGGHVEMVELLLAHGAAVNAQASNGWTPLMLATARGFGDVVRRLLAHGANPNLADIYGWTPLMRAIDLDRPGIARVLLESTRLDPEVRNENGHTALHHAAAQGSEPLVRLLLARGADPRARDTGGRTPAAVARLQGHPGVAKVLQDAVR